MGDDDLICAEEDANASFDESEVGSSSCSCPLEEKAISGEFFETEAYCGDLTHVRARGENIAEDAETIFSFTRIRDGRSLGEASGPMRAQFVDNLEYDGRKPYDWQACEFITFTVAADGVDNNASNQFQFSTRPDYGPETVTHNCHSAGASGTRNFRWTGKYAISYTTDTILVNIKIKLINRQGEKPASGDPMPAAGDPVSDEDKAAMKSDIEAKLSSKVVLYRQLCRYADGCSCPVPIEVQVDFVEDAEHHEVNLFQGSGGASASNWTRVKTRDNSWAHETGHLLGFYDEYPTGAIGAPPRWRPAAMTAIMRQGLDFPPAYGWDWRDWFNGETGEEWRASEP